MGCDEPLIQAVYDLESPRMAFGRVCLIGDAASGLRPHVAAGQAKACADAWALRGRARHGMWRRPLRSGGMGTTATCVGRASPGSYQGDGKREPVRRDNGAGRPRLEIRAVGAGQLILDSSSTSAGSSRSPSSERRGESVSSHRPNTLVRLESFNEGDGAGWAAMGADYFQRKTHEGEPKTDDLGEDQILVVSLPLVATHQVNGVDGRSRIVRRR